MDGRQNRLGNRSRPSVIERIGLVPNRLPWWAVIFFMIQLLLDPFAFHLSLVKMESMFALVHVTMLIENERNASRITAIRMTQSRCGMKFVFGAFEKNRSVAQGDGHSTDFGVSEILLVVAHLDGCLANGRSRIGSGRRPLPPRR